ncbi:hypothetical protein AGDE_02921 [Angomonas deanei]|nr:hypothetical protein AGDE_02921 [Angomonas deanei]|eukprot:EPY41004.1 hypothetical protein AGDE_02921 [Angomonas deanei]
MNIVTSYFKVKRIEGSVFVGETSLKYANERQREYLTALTHNAAHADVQRVLLLVEGADAYRHFREHVLFNPALFPPLSLAKIIPILRLHHAQPTYAELFYQANQLLQHSLTMVCNADVHLSPTSFSVKAVQGMFSAMEAKGNGAQPLALALTRHESDNVADAPLVYDYRGSHDAFILKPPLPLDVLAGVTHPQNCYQSENIVIHELKKGGYTVLNPCLDLILVHQHAVDLRQWRPSVDSSRYGRAHPMDSAAALRFIQNM